MKIVLTAASSTLEALQSLMPGASNRTLRQMLAHGRVWVNGDLCKMGTRVASAGDVVEVRDKSLIPQSVRGLQVVYEDEHLVVIHKPDGLLTVATPYERERTAYHYLREYVKESDPRNKLFVVHRLDKFVSGLLVFARTEQVKRLLQAKFRRHDIERKYWAIVEGEVSRPEGVIESYLAEGRDKRIHSTPDPSSGKLSVTRYRVMRRAKSVTALEITLETGRKNQIRAHMAEMGHPVVGDRAYGSADERLGRVGLHAFRLGFVHPVNAKALRFETPAPPEFRKYLVSEKARLQRSLKVEDRS